MTNLNRGPQNQINLENADAVMKSQMTFEEVLGKIKTKKHWKDFEASGKYFIIYLLVLFFPDDPSYGKHFIREWFLGKKK